MPFITFSGRTYKIRQDRPLLESLLERGVSIPYSCRSGYCHACLIKAEKGTPPGSSQKTLEQDKVSQGYFLACQCYPEQDMQVSLAVRDKIPAIITGKVPLSPTVVALDIAPRHPVHYAPGQHLNLWATNLMPRPCYLASVPELDQQLTVHIERRVNGSFSHWAHDCTQAGQKILISDVRGVSFYQTFSPGLITKPYLMIAQEGCLAPVLAILRQTLNRHPAFNARLFLQADHEQNLYALDTLREIQHHHPAFSFSTALGSKAMAIIEQSVQQLPAKQPCIIAGTQNFIGSFGHYPQLDILPLPYS